MEEQPSFLFPREYSNRLTIEDGFVLLWKYHLDVLPSGKSYHGNRVALCKSMGGVYMDVANELDVRKHLSSRDHLSPQTRLHDITLLDILFNQFRKWRRKRFKLDGFECARLLLPLENPTVDVDRPRATPRYYMVPPNDLARFMEHASQRLRNIMCFYIDTAMSECDLRRIKTINCNPVDQTVSFVRKKTEKKVKKIRTIPLSERCWEIVRGAILQKREYVLDFTDHGNEFYEIRAKAGVYFQKRDLRKTNANVIARKFRRSDAKRILTHQSQRTTDDFYLIEDNSDLKPKVQYVSDQFGGKRFSVGEKSC